jgi:hypothetical protein
MGAIPCLNRVLGACWHPQPISKELALVPGVAIYLVNARRPLRLSLRPFRFPFQNY